MNYSLGNMLNGGESLNADGLSLDLQFATDKTLTARKGPTPTFTRASAATNYGLLVQFDGQTYPATGIVNGRTEWKIVDGSDYKSFSYTGGMWRYEEFISGEGTTYDSAATSAFRPEQANWSASGLTSSPTTSSTFGIVRVATNEPRFDHNPTTLASLGLLIEESRTNLLLQSQTFGTTWTAANLNTTGTPAYLNVAAGPDGAMTAEKLIATALLTTHQFRQNVTLVSGTTYSLTCYFKAAEQQFSSIAVFGVANGNADWVSLFNISSSPSTGTFNGFSSTSVTNIGNGWVRCTVVFTATASGSLEIRLGGASGTSGINPHIYLGDGTSGILIWGAQLEAGAFPTSYIPTTTASVVRSADVCSITGASFTGFYNQSEGTFFAQSTKVTTNANAFVVAANNNTFNEDIDLRYNSVTTVAALINVANAGQLTGTTATVTSGSSPKQTLGYRLNDCAYSANGATVITDTSALTPTVSQLNIGNTANGSLALNGHIASIRYFKKRLANAKLTQLTT
jgi:hypothetical protein